MAPLCPVVVGDDVQQCRDMLKPMLALYISGMGARGKNYHNSLAALRLRGGRGENPGPHLSGMKGEAALTVPDKLVDEIALVEPGADRGAARRLAGGRDLDPDRAGAPDRGPCRDGGAGAVKDAFAAALDAPVERAVLPCRRGVEGGVGGRLSGRELLIRRAAGVEIHQATLTLEQEFEVLRAAEPG